MKINPIWETIQGILKDWPVEKFKEHPVVRKWLLSTDHHSVEELLEATCKINQELYYDLKPKIKESNIGYEKVIESENLSKKTAIQFYYLIKILSNIPKVKLNNILEIGGGYGNQAYLFQSLDLCFKYHLLDVFVINNIQEYYLSNSLSKEKFANVYLYNVENNDHEVLKSIDYNLTISSFALTEVPAEMQEIYVREIICRSEYIYIVGQRYFKGQDNNVSLLPLISEYFEMEKSDSPFYDSSRETFELIGTNKKISKYEHSYNN